MKIRNDRILWIAAAAFYAVVLPVSGWMGIAVENSKAIQAESGMLHVLAAQGRIDPFYCIQLLRRKSQFPGYNVG